jgi:hypothetical protein
MLYLFSCPSLLFSTTKTSKTIPFTRRHKVPRSQASTRARSTHPYSVSRRHSMISSVPCLSASPTPISAMAPPANSAIFGSPSEGSRWRTRGGGE